MNTIKRTIGPARCIGVTVSTYGRRPVVNGNVTNSVARSNAWKPSSGKNSKRNKQSVLRSDDDFKRAKHDNTEKQMMSGMTIPIPANFGEVKKEIWEGDLILVRNQKGIDIRTAKAAWWNDEVFAIEVRKDEGVVIVPLEQLVRLYPGSVDVYEVNPQNRWKHYDRHGAIHHLKDTLLSKTDSRSAVVETFRKLIFRTDKKIVKTPYGAEAIRLADRLGGGVEPLPDRTNTGIGPTDLARSPLYRYRFTLQ